MRDNIEQYSIFYEIYQTVNLTTYVFEGSNPSPTTTLRSRRVVVSAQHQKQGSTPKTGAAAFFDRLST